MTTDELLSGMVAEEVEPGVLHILNDGHRELSNEDLGFPGSSVDVTPDGSVWVGGSDDMQSLFRLGDASTFDDVTEGPPYKEVGPDGSLWTIGEKGIHRFAGQAWARADGPARHGTCAGGAGQSDPTGRPGRSADDRGPAVSRMAPAGLPVHRPHPSRR